MKSKQLNFYSHPEEMRKILEFLLLNNTNFSIEPFLTNQFKIFESADFFKQHELIHRIILHRINEKEQNIIVKFIDTQNYFLFDDVESNIIEFSFPHIREGNILYRSRFYFKSGYWKGDDFIKKDEEFIKWGTNLMRNFKKEFLTSKEPYLGEYCTDYTKNLIDKNEIVLRQL